MTEKDIKEFKEIITIELMETYHLSEIEAVRMIKESYLPIALKADPEDAMHDSAQYWIELIYNEATNADLKEM